MSPPTWDKALGVHDKNIGNNKDDNIHKSKNEQSIAKFYPKIKVGIIILESILLQEFSCKVWNL